MREGLQKQGENGRDRLIYLFDLGLALHQAGDYGESIKIFREADRLAEIKDYTSLAEEGATLLVSENIKDYKGEDFENVLISTYLAMNYAALGDLEGALVEARRVNRKLYMMVSEGKRKYKQNAFARYLSGILYETERNWNDAYVDYKQTRELIPDFPGLGRDLWRLAKLTKNAEDQARWQKEYSLTETDREEAMRIAPKRGRMELGEIVILYQNGISPIKQPNPSFRQVPKFFPRSNPVPRASVEMDARPVGPTAMLHDIEQTAVENLDEKYAGLIAKKIAGVVAKEVIAHQVEEQSKSPLLGLLTRAALYASDQADLRSWNLLPKDLQMIRVPASPGAHTIRVLPEGASPLPEKTVQVEAGQRVFLSFRYTP